jgi:YhcG PDDEXK nuclease domain
MLVQWIESDLYSRQGKAVTNFKKVLPAPQSDLADAIVRDPYKLDFLTLRKDAAERDLEEGLAAHVREFLLELGAGFAFATRPVVTVRLLRILRRDPNVSMPFIQIESRGRQRGDTNPIWIYINKMAALESVFHTAITRAGPSRS